MKKIVIVGGSGFVGSKLSKLLFAKGYGVIVVDKVMPRDMEGIQFVAVDTEHETFPHELVEGVYGIINLAGAPINARWSKEYKNTIKTSRINTTRHIVEAFSQVSNPPEVLVSASAIGFYGDGEDLLLSEEKPAGSDFLAQVCKEWEEEALKARIGRVVVLRTAHVLGSGGIIGELVKLFRIGLGGYFGQGRQYMPWVHIDDLVAQYVFAIEHESMTGVYNTASGIPVTQKTFMQTLRDVLGVRFCWKIPTLAARMVKGEFAQVFLGGQKIDSSKIKKQGFVFLHTDLKQALSDILRTT